MANGLSQNWRKDGPTSRVAQAAYTATQQRQSCSHAEPQHYCPKHAYRGCPAAEVA